MNIARKGIKHYCVPWETGNTDGQCQTALRAPYNREQAIREAESIQGMGLKANVVEHTDFGAAMEYLLRVREYLPKETWEAFKRATHSGHADTVIDSLYQKPE